MDDWQECLSPLCQTALQHARNNVLDRGGLAITVEDYLLALMDSVPSITAFLRRRGIDMDELTRTIQCEQPIVTAISGDGMLSSQLQYWLATAHEASETAWLDWPRLLSALVRQSERLSGKAYVAVLEQVEHWPSDETMGRDRGASRSVDTQPSIISDPAWLQLAEDVSVLVSAQPKAVVWLQGPSGSGKTTWLKALGASLNRRYLMLDLRRETEIMASVESVMPHAENGRCDPPLLVLDNVSPADLGVLLLDGASVAAHLVPGHEGPILMLSAAVEPEAVVNLECRLGRRLLPIGMPLVSSSQMLAIVTAHQPVIERQWGVEINGGVLGYVSSHACLRGMTPGVAIEWVSRAAARMALWAQQGPTELRRLTGEQQTLRRQLLVAIARHQPVAELERAIDALSAELDAQQDSWSKALQSKVARQVTLAQVKAELEHWPDGQGIPASEPAKPYRECALGDAGQDWPLGP